MKNLEQLRLSLEKRRHPGWRAVQAMMDLSNSPLFIAGAARLIAEAAEKDHQASREILASLAKSTETE